ncbi:MAG: RNA degradosome polyphosphate kinase [Lachnospiraceae bacterium]|nr:RNA degradosome polyphosphate kinase [Lachnospiraceae bacterium]
MADNKNKSKNNTKAKNVTANTDLSDPSLYTNRELSWLKFNLRIIEEARDKSNPLMERVKFLSISASNLDEFFMVRVASLRDMAEAGYKGRDIAGMSVKEQLGAVGKATHEMERLQYNTFNHMLLSALKNAGFELLLSHRDMSDDEAEYADRYFENSIYPVLTPMAVDSSRPFPLIANKTLNIAAMLDVEEGGLLGGKQNIGDKVFAAVQVPSVLPRLIELPASGEGHRRFIMLEQIILRNIQKVFLGYSIVCTASFRVMRSADFTIDEDEAADLLQEIEKQLKARRRGRAICLEVENGTDKKLLNRLLTELDLKEEDVYTTDGPIDLTFLMKIYSTEGFDEFKEHAYASPQPVTAFEKENNVFDVIKKGDVLMHHPYESFEPVVRFISQAASDPSVLAIKQTLYRVSGNSPIIKALAQAADNGKQVTVLVELKARFDEENNIVWARMLEQAGCHVIYGLVGLKTHSKITLVVRREEDGIRRYVHLSTGNYNDSTAKLYTDVGLFTCSETIGEDATAVFNMLSGYSEPRGWNKLSVAPLWLKDRFLYLIDRETDNAKEGKEAHIIAKINALCDPDIISALYAASMAGVKVELIVRGICSLKVGIPGISENISVRSIVGNYLEHARIFYFYNEGKKEYYLASADWMPRNLERRVELLFPVEKQELKDKLEHILEYQLKDTLKAHVMDDNGDYQRVDLRGKEKFCAQLAFSLEAVEESKRREEEESTGRLFMPETGQPHGSLIKKS